MRFRTEQLIKPLLVFIFIMMSLSAYYYKKGETTVENYYYSNNDTQNLTYYQEHSLELILNHQEDFHRLGYQNEEINEMIFVLTYEELKDVLKNEIGSKTLVPYLEFSNFRYRLLKSYERILKTNEITHLEAINRTHHPNMTSDFYDSIQTALNPHTELVLVNKNYSLERNYIPLNLVSITDLPLVIPDEHQNRNKVNEVTYDALKAMFQDSKKEGLNLFVSSGYRSYTRQDTVYNYYLVEGGQSYADSFSARPGHSEHQTGFAVDVTCRDIKYRLVEAFEDTLEGSWIKEHAHLYGFIIRYPKNRESSTGYSYEPWHLRYVGKDVAKTIYNEDILLEDYLLKYTELPN